MLEDLETDTDDNMVDITDFLKDPQMKTGLLDLNKQISHSQQLKSSAPHLKTVPPTYQ